MLEDNKHFFSTLLGLFTSSENQYFERRTKQETYMKKLLLLILLLFSSQVFSETYICSTVNFLGEIDTEKFERSGKDFWVGGKEGGRRWDTLEDDRMILLSNISHIEERLDSTSQSSFVVGLYFINKETNQWGSTFSTFSTVINNLDSSISGTCVVVD